MVHHIIRGCWVVAIVLGCGSSFAADAAPANPKALMIVSPDTFHPVLGAYVTHKQQQLPTRLVSLEEVLKTSPGVDDPERLKHYLFDAWKKENLGYVLLVGDTDVMPVRYMTLDRASTKAFNYAFYPSDLYYADLANAAGEFDNWNARNDSFHANYFGEVRGETNKNDPINFDNVDYRPDVAVGRWPVSTSDEVKIVADKTIRYGMAVLQGRGDWLKRVALISVSRWVDSRPALDRVGSLMPGWTLEKRYYASWLRDDKTPPPNYREVEKLLNSGVGLAFHAGHGQDDQWEQCFSVKSLQKVHNADRLPVMVSAGCSTARMATLPPYEPYTDLDGNDHRGSDHGEVFASPPPAPSPYQRGPHNPTGLGEQLLRGGPDGAVAYIGCNTGSQPSGLTLVEGFAMTFAHTPAARLGDCWSGAVSYYYDRQHLTELKPTRSWVPPSVFFQAMKFMVYGDPSLLMPAESTEPESP